MKARTFSIVLILALFLTACGEAATAPPASPAALTQSPGDADPTAAQTGDNKAVGGSSASALTSEPLQVTVRLEDSSRVTEEVPLDGKTLALTGKDGAKYTLEIPDRALAEPVTVKMTLVEQVAGLPFGSPGATYAVHLEPEGLFFYRPATLTIEPPAELPVDEQILFGYQQGGAAVYLAQPELNSRAIKIVLPHFSGYGVTQGQLADADATRDRLGASHEQRLQSEIASLLQKERQRQLQGGDENDSPLAESLDPLFQEYYEKVVQPRIAAAGENCAAGKLAVRTAIGYERQRQLLGMEGDSPQIDLEQVVTTASRACLREEYSLCAEEHIIYRMIPVWLGLERQEQLLGMSSDEAPSALVQEARDLTQKCLTFELVFESSGTMGDASLGFDGSVKASVPLKLDIDKINIIGSDTLEVISSEFYAENCTVNYSPQDGTFEVRSMYYIVEPENYEMFSADSGTPDSSPRVVDLPMKYFPGTDTGDFSVVCDGEQYAQAPGASWWATFMISHEDEQDLSDTGITYTADHWTVHGGELFAERSWSKSAPDTGTSEQGSMKLYHRPGKE